MHRSFPFLKDACASVSVACSEASGDRIRLGSSSCVTKVLAAARKAGPSPVRSAFHGSRAKTPDVAHLIGEAWAYGPNSSLSLGHLKEKLVILLAVDTAARPSDITRLYRSFDGPLAQIVFHRAGGRDAMRIRYFWSKEIDPGSGRRNSTNKWFSTWVQVFCTSPKEVCSHCVMQDFLARSSDERLFAKTFIPELNCRLQPLVYARLSQGKLQAASRDHISNIVKAAWQRVGFPSASCRDVRGASTSKIIQCAPQLKDEALALGRWTTAYTWDNHYQGDVDLLRQPPSEGVRGSCQDVLRWGFIPSPPGTMSAEDYMRPPQFYVGRSFPWGVCTAFDDGDYTIMEQGRSRKLPHWDFMQRLAT